MVINKDDIVIRPEALDDNPQAGDRFEQWTRAGIIIAFSLLGLVSGIFLFSFLFRNAISDNLLMLDKSQDSTKYLLGQVIAYSPLLIGLFLAIPVYLMARLYVKAFPQKEMKTPVRVKNAPHLIGFIVFSIIIVGLLLLSKFYYYSLDTGFSNTPIIILIATYIFGGLSFMSYSLMKCKNVFLKAIGALSLLSCLLVILYLLLVFVLTLLDASGIPFMGAGKSIDAILDGLRFYLLDNLVFSLAVFFSLIAGYALLYRSKNRFLKALGCALLFGLIFGILANCSIISIAEGIHNFKSDFPGSTVDNAEIGQAVQDTTSIVYASAVCGGFLGALIGFFGDGSLLRLRKNHPKLLPLIGGTAGSAIFFGVIWISLLLVNECRAIFRAFNIRTVNVTAGNPDKYITVFYYPVLGGILTMAILFFLAIAVCGVILYYLRDRTVKSDEPPQVPHTLVQKEEIIR